MIKELILGCGTNPKKLVISPLNLTNKFDNPTTCDFYSYHNPDVIVDLNVLPWIWEDNTFDEIHAYNILEHLGAQGDYKTFFKHFEEMWRILKPGGYICGITPDYNSKHLWGDPGHTRAITKIMLEAFLSQEEYHKQVGKTAMTDYRFCYKADFEYIHFQNDMIGEEVFCFVLKAHKPIRSFNKEDK